MEAITSRQKTTVQHAVLCFARCAVLALVITNSYMLHVTCSFTNFICAELCGLYEM